MQLKRQKKNVRRRQKPLESNCRSFRMRFAGGSKIVWELVLWLIVWQIILLKRYSSAIQQKLQIILPRKSNRCSRDLQRFVVLFLILYKRNSEPHFPKILILVTKKTNCKKLLENTLKTQYLQLPHLQL